MRRILKNAYIIPYNNILINTINFKCNRMKKFFFLCAALITAVTISAAEITVDLSKAKGYTHAESGSGAVELADGILTVNWTVGTGWEVAGTEIALDNLEGVEKLNFEYVGDGGGTTMYVYLRDSEGNRWWNEDGYGLSVAEWTPVEFVPASPLWDAPDYEVGAKPFVSIGFIANPAEPTNGVFKLRNLKVTVEDGEVPVDDNIIYEWAPENGIGETILGEAGVEVTTVKIHENADEVPAIKFGNSYKFADGKYIAIKPAEGGFKAGDELQVAFCFNNSDDTKEARVAVYAADTETQLFLSELAINGRTNAADPAVEKFVLEADQDVLYIGRQGNTGLFVISLKVVREGGEVPPVVEPKEPEFPIASTWFATTDQWVEEKESTAAYDEAGEKLTVSIAADKVAQWQGQVKLQAPAAKAGKLYDFSLKMKSNVDLGGVTVKYQDDVELIYDPAIELKAGEELAWAKNDLVGKDGGNGIIVLDFGFAKAGTVIEVYDIALVEKEGEIPEITKPETAPAAPERAEEDVMAVFCNRYAENNLNFEVLGWGGVSTWENLEIEGTNVMYCQDMKWEILTNWDAASYDFSAYEKFHFDVWSPAVRWITVTFEALGAGDGGSGYKQGVAFKINAGWNTIDADPSWWIPENASYDWKDVKYVIFEGYKNEDESSAEGTPFAFANLYWWKSSAPKGIPEVAPNAPVIAEDHVQALFSATYQERTFNFAPQFWGCGWVEHTYENGQKIWFAENMTWEAFTNWDAASYDLTNEPIYDMLHADIFVTVDANIKITFEALGVNDGGSGWKNGALVEGLKANEWNSVDVDLLAAPYDTYEFTDMKYLILEGFTSEGTPLAIANAYFYSSMNQAVENVEVGQKAVKRIINGQLFIEKNGVLYNVLGAQF